ncbi:MAG: ABC transporter permease [Bdellovibrio sp.]|nr:ABC transporter permease [Bdellovibrio sp.]
MKRFFTVLVARNKEFIRDQSALGWNLLFPILVIFGFAYAFSSGSQDVFKVSWVSQEEKVSTANEFEKTQYIQFIPSKDLEGSLDKLKRHQVDLVLKPRSPSQGSPSETPATDEYWINSTSPKGYLLERILKSTQTPTRIFEKQTVSGQEIRYVDWLISGLLAMNMMFSALFGVGYTMVRYRKTGVLKRLRATPLSSFEFLLAQVASRLILITGVTAAVYVGSHAFIHFKMMGSYLNLFLVMFLGAMCLISLSLCVASRTASEEFAGGLLNLISWPMMFLSEVWFSLEGAHPWVKASAQMMPLTHIIRAARAIMTEGAGLQQVSLHLGVLALMTVFFLGIGSYLFRWR